MATGTRLSSTSTVDRLPAMVNTRRLTSSVAALLILMVGCGGTPVQTDVEGAAPLRQFDGDYPIKVLCTTGQVAEMAARVGGARVTVDALMGPGVDPHLFTPVHSDNQKIAAADVILYNGLHLEGRMTDLFERLAARKATYAVTSGLVERKDERLREPPEFEGLYDPHVWHDAALWADCVTDVAELFAAFDPPHADDYRANAEAYRGELLALDEYCREQIARIPAERRVLVTAHDAFGYFGAAYGIEVHGLKGISTEEEKDLAHQEAIQRLLIERQIPAIFVESAVSARTVESLAEPCRAAGLDLKVPEQPLYADAMGPAGSDAADFAGMLRHNVRVIVEALGPE